MKPALVVSLFTVAFFPALSGAAELKINPGLWETTMTMTNPMTGQPTVKTSKECVRERSFDPATMMEGAQGCTLARNELNGDTLNFQMNCDMEGSKAVVTGEYQTDGKTGRGNMDMEVNAGGMKMSMNMNWTGKRLGDC